MTFQNQEFKEPVSEFKDQEMPMYDNLDEKLINFQSPNLLNQMLPYSASV